LEFTLLSSLTIRAKLLVTVAFPLVSIVGLAAVAYPTFETVKVNGPQYAKIRAAKDLEADILPPPGFGVEAFLDAGLLTDAPSLQRRNQLASEIKRLHTEFTASHKGWQTQLPEGDAIRSSMADASKRGEEMFGQMQSLLVAPSEQFFDADPTAATAARELARANYTKVLLPLYESHKVAIDESVRLSLERQSSLESETRSLVSSRLLLMLIATLSAFGLIALVASTIARSIRRPIKALTDAARHTAEHELPETVARIQAGASADTEMTRSVFADNTDEIGELARAFDSMHSSSVHLAAEQARIRRNVADNLINIGRRSQGLLKRNLSHLTKMENDERDAAKLDQLFRLDHLTTRMRRNAESILVLAGSESPKVWAQPMPVEDMVRSALGQIEAYDRVDLGNMEFARLRGNAIGDLSHLLAELLENATQFSPPKSRVSVFGKQRLDGYLLVISDDGVGMTASEFDRVNTVLSNPAEFDTEATKVLGHIVVGRLALRHGVRVRVTESATTGVAAQVMIPRGLIEDDVPVESGPWAGSENDGDPGLGSSFDAGVASSPSSPVSAGSPVAFAGAGAIAGAGVGAATNSVGSTHVGVAQAQVPTVGSVLQTNDAQPQANNAQPTALEAPRVLSGEASLPTRSKPTVLNEAALENTVGLIPTAPGQASPVLESSRGANTETLGSPFGAESPATGTDRPSGVPVAALPVAALPVAALPVAALPVAPFPVAPLPVAALPVGAPTVASVPAAVQQERAPGLLAQRVRGAQLPVTTFTPSVAAEPRDAGSVRSALSSLQRGMAAGKSETGPADSSSASFSSAPVPTPIPSPSVGAEHAPSSAPLVAHAEQFRPGTLSSRLAESVSDTTTSTHAPGTTPVGAPNTNPFGTTSTPKDLF
jgi:signal transduction histidine kinase